MARGVIPYPEDPYCDRMKDLSKAVAALKKTVAALKAKKKAQGKKR
jgi:hypothetical protein